MDDLIEQLFCDIFFTNVIVCKFLPIRKRLKIDIFLYFVRHVFFCVFWGMIFSVFLCFLLVRVDEGCVGKVRHKPNEW